MKKNITTRLLLACACLLSTLACSFGGLLNRRPAEAGGEQVGSVFLLGDKVVYPGLGFSFRRPLDGTIRQDGNSVELTNEEQGIDIYLFSGFSDDSSQLESTLGSWTGGMRTDFETFQGNEPETIAVGGTQALLVQIGVHDPDNTFSGFLLVAPLNEHRLFYFSYYAPVELGSVDWKYHQALVRQFLAGIDLFRPENAACAVSDDPTFGYTVENPVAIGKQVSGGYGRAFSFMQNLVGRDGNSFLYDYKNVTIEDGRNVYIYRVFVDSPDERMMYLVMADPKTEMIPQGFICAAELERIW
jgi:hypothetical protein